MWVYGAGVSSAPAICHLPSWLFYRRSRNIGFTEERLPLIARADRRSETVWKRNGIVDEDVLMLLPSTDGDGYSLQYFVCVYPVDFNAPSQHWALSCATLTSSCLINKERDSLWAWTDT